MCQKALGASRRRLFMKWLGEQRINEKLIIVNLYQELEQNFLLFPNKIGLITESARFSYQEIADISAKIANCMISLGLKPGDRMAVQVDKSSYNFFLYLACLRAGI